MKKRYSLVSLHSYTSFHTKTEKLSNYNELFNVFQDKIDFMVGFQSILDRF